MGKKRLKLTLYGFYYFSSGIIITTTVKPPRSSVNPSSLTVGCTEVPRSGVRVSLLLVILVGFIRLGCRDDDTPPAVFENPERGQRRRRRWRALKYRLPVRVVSLGYI